jgi:hypothetical protein
MELVISVTGVIIGLVLIVMALSAPSHIKWWVWVYVVGVGLLWFSTFAIVANNTTDTPPPVPDKICFEGTQYLLFNGHMIVQLIDNETVNCR